jgi:nitroreductase
LSEKSTLKRQKMSIPNIAKKTLSTLFNFMRLKSLMLQDDNRRWYQIYFRNSPFITKFFGFEPWHFIVVQDPALRELIKPVAWELL